MMMRFKVQNLLPIPNMHIIVLINVVCMSVCLYVTSAICQII